MSHHEHQTHQAYEHQTPPPETIPHPQTDPVGSLEHVLDPTTTWENERPATPEDFNATKSLLEQVTMRHGSSGRHAHDQGVMASTYLRPRGASEDGPRFKVVVDPMGVLESGNYKGTPNFRIDVEQGKKAWYSKGTPKNSWQMSLHVHQRGGKVLYDVVAGVNQGNGKVEQSPLSSFQPQDADTKLTDWVSALVGDPLSLEAAPTKKEKGLLKRLGFRGLGSRY